MSPAASAVNQRSAAACATRIGGVRAARRRLAARVPAARLRRRALAALLGGGDLVLERDALGAGGRRRRRRSAAAAAARRRRPTRAAPRPRSAPGAARPARTALSASAGGVVEDVAVGAGRRALALVAVEVPVEVDLAVRRADGARRIGIRPGAVDDVDRRRVVGGQPEVLTTPTSSTVPSPLSTISSSVIRLRLLNGLAARLLVPLLELPEAPQLVDAPVHARDEGGERRGARVERRLVARAAPRG